MGTGGRRCGWPGFQRVQIHRRRLGYHEQRCLQWDGGLMRETVHRGLYR